VSESDVFYDASIYRTYNYGIRAGYYDFHVDFNYLVLEGFSDYPLGLFGFPSVKLTFIRDNNSYFDKSRWAFFGRFSTLNTSGIPLLPDIGVIGLDMLDFFNVMFLYSFPLEFNISIRIYWD